MANGKRRCFLPIMSMVGMKQTSRSNSTLLVFLSAGATGTLLYLQ